MKTFLNDMRQIMCMGVDETNDVSIDLTLGSTSVMVTLADYADKKAVLEALENVRKGLVECGHSITEHDILDLGDRLQLFMNC